MNDMEARKAAVLAILSEAKEPLSVPQIVRGLNDSLTRAQVSRVLDKLKADLSAGTSGTATALRWRATRRIKSIPPVPVAEEGRSNTTHSEVLAPVQGPPKKNGPAPTMESLKAGSEDDQKFLFTMEVWTDSVRISYADAARIFA